MMIAPGMVQVSAARSAFEQREEDLAYKALSINGLNDVQRPAAIAAAPVAATTGAGQAVEPTQVLPYRQQREY